MAVSYKTYILLFILLSGCVTMAQTQMERYAEINSYLNQVDGEDFSGTVLIAHKDRIIEARAYGQASIEFEIPNKIDTKFNIASITKLFTAVATLQLYERGKIELYKPVGDYLPDYPNQLVRDSVNIHQLLTHTSGLNNFYIADFDKITNLEYENVSDFVPLFVNDTLLSRPGTKYDYSASGYVVLGLIIEKVSGKSYYRYVKDSILKPTKMVNTLELAVDSIATDKASGYTSMWGAYETLKRNDYYLTKASPGGFYYATIADLFKFSKALRNHQLLSKETTELMFAPKVKGYNTHIGYGIEVDQRYNQTILGHSGGWYGIHCELMDFMEDEYTVIILSNQDDDGKTGATKLTDFFMGLLAGKEMKD